MNVATLVRTVLIQTALVVTHLLRDVIYKVLYESGWVIWWGYLFDVKWRGNIIYSFHLSSSFSFSSRRRPSRRPTTTSYTKEYSGRRPYYTNLRSSESSEISRGIRPAQISSLLLLSWNSWELLWAYPAWRNSIRYCWMWSQYQQIRCQAEFTGFIWLLGNTVQIIHIPQRCIVTTPGHSRVTHDQDSDTISFLLSFCSWRRSWRRNHPYQLRGRLLLLKTKSRVLNWVSNQIRLSKYCKL